jgi:hypothetical protein
MLKEGNKTMKQNVIDNYEEFFRSTFESLNDTVLAGAALKSM